MKTTLLKYRIIIEKEKQKKGFVYIAYAPSLGVSDFGKTIEKAKENIEEAIRCYIEGLILTKREVPVPDDKDYYVGQAEVSVENNPVFSSHA